ncbi:MAG: HAD-IA family hydrolase, partial [Alphaproteobacteria bacterium]|nr:HAD-IA family hydrolase [Alphaproteobacteria bacterium]
PSKPHPSMIMSALQETGGGTDEAVMIGDTTFDMEMARSAGVAALGVGWGYHSVPTLQRAGAEHITLNVETLLTDIERLCAQRSPVLG